MIGFPCVLCYHVMYRLLNQQPTLCETKRLLLFPLLKATISSVVRESLRLPNPIIGEKCFVVESTLTEVGGILGRCQKEELTRSARSFGANTFAFQGPLDDGCVIVQHFLQVLCSRFSSSWYTDVRNSFVNGLPFRPAVTLVIQVRWIWVVLVVALINGVRCQSKTPILVTFSASDHIYTRQGHGTRLKHMSVRSMSPVLDCCRHVHE